MGFNPEDYEPVAARLDRWLKAHPEGRVITDLVHYLPDTAVFKAELYIADILIATGWAEEVRGQGNVNRTSHIENCETSAVGRALANAGMAGSDFTKRPSREEMTKVFTSNGQQREQFKQGNVTISRPAGLASDKQKNMIRAVCKSQGMTPPANLDSMDKAQASAFIDRLKAGEGNAMADQEDNNLAAEEPF